MTRIAVYGATGTTGALVVREVVRRGFSCRALGRNRQALAALGAAINIETVACEVTAVAPALAGVDLVINCAGPFSETRRELEDAAIQAGIHAAHISGEPSELVKLFSRDAELRAAGVTVVGAAGFSSAVVELACWLAVKDLAPPISIEIVHAAVASVPSVGSLRSYLASTDAGGAGNDEVKVVDLPAPVGPRAVRNAPSVESLTVPRSLNIESVTSFFAVGPPRTAETRPAVFMRDRDALERLLAWRDAKGARGPDDVERAAMAFVLVATASTPVGRSRTVEMVGADPYGLTALLAVQIAVDVIRAPKPGARAPLEVLDPQPALAALARAGVRWTVKG